MRFPVKNLILLFVLLAFKMQSQTEIKKIYNYTFEGSLQQEFIPAFEQRLSQLTFVTSAKVKYKSPAQKGEIHLEIAEPAKTAEGDKGFDIIELKKLIQSYNLIPGELKHQN